MKFKSFKVVPCIRVWFPEEGVGYYELDEDQDPRLLAQASEAELSAGCVLTPDLELRWTRGGSTMAVRLTSDEEAGETPTSGDFAGLGWLVVASYTIDGKHGVTVLAEGDDQEWIENICAALQSLLEPVCIVADVSKGILNGTWSDRPARVLYISDDPGDVLGFYDDYYLVPADENMNRPNAWWLHDADLDGGIIDHFHNQVKP